MLEVTGLSVRFGGVKALHDVELTVDDGQVCGLIGPNGAGKTTLFNCLSRLAEPSSGSIRFDGVEVLERKPHEIAGLGIARTFQHLALVPSLTVRENVMLGAHHRHRSGFVAAALHLPLVQREEAAMTADADEALERVRLDRHRRPSRRRPRRTASSSASSWPARCARRRGCCAWTSPPPASATVRSTSSPSCCRRSPPSSSLTVLIVEHHMGLVMRVCDKVVVLDFGRVIAVDGSFPQNRARAQRYCRRQGLLYRPDFFARKSRR